MSYTPSKASPKKAIQRVDSLEEASAIISNLRKLKAANQKQNISSTAASDFNLQSVEHFDRVVSSTCLEVRSSNDQCKRINSQLVSEPMKQSPPRLAPPQEEPGKDFRASLLAHVYNSPSRKKDDGNDSDWSDIVDDGPDDIKSLQIDYPSHRSGTDYGTDDNDAYSGIDDICTESLATSSSFRPPINSKDR